MLFLECHEFREGSGLIPHGVTSKRVRLSNDPRFRPDIPRDVTLIRVFIHEQIMLSGLSSTRVVAEVFVVVLHMRVRRIFRARLIMKLVL